ncbi:MAG TPA: hypothetical protein VNX86_01045 [Rhizomicrobium sp.]|jgi:putative chitinase|nr:hypothetical protein [Rhizomicrobium sp.]
MRAITPALLHALARGGSPSLIAALAPSLARGMPPAAIDTPLRAAHFLAQGCHETFSFTRLEEDLAYSAARIAQVWPRLAPRAALSGHPETLGNAAYAGSNGNGGEESGDGWRFRGRGFFQLTGRANYALAGAVGDPDTIATPDGAVTSALAFWRTRAIAAAADADDVMRVTRLVNGGANGVGARARLTRRALELLGS